MIFKVVQILIFPRFWLFTFEGQSRNFNDSGVKGAVRGHVLFYLFIVTSIYVISFRTITY